DQRVAIADNAFSNESRDGAELDAGTGRDLIYRADASFAVAPTVTLEGGGELRRSAATGREQRLAGGRFQSREDFDAGNTNESIYAQAKVAAPKGVTITPGARVDHRGLTATTSVSPWIQALWPLTPALAVRAGAGVYHQEPEFAEVLGARGNASLGL